MGETIKISEERAVAGVPYICMLSAGRLVVGDKDERRERRPAQRVIVVRWACAGAICKVRLQ